MGKRGPKPTPTKILENRGSWRATVRSDEPTPDVKIPSAPTWLDREGRREWGRLTRELEKLGIVAQVDRSTLAAYCQAYANLYRAQKEIKVGGITTVSATGSVIKHPAMAVMEKAIDQILKGAALFGLSPASRVGLKSPSRKKEKDDRSRFFGKKRQSSAS